jgi:hypothetical protein
MAGIAGICAGREEWAVWTTWASPTVDAYGQLLSVRQRERHRRHRLDGRRDRLQRPIRRVRQALDAAIDEALGRRRLRTVGSCVGHGG